MATYINSIHILQVCIQQGVVCSGWCCARCTPALAALVQDHQPKANILQLLATCTHASGAHDIGLQEHLQQHASALISLWLYIQARGGHLLHRALATVLLPRHAVHSNS
jgi:hypothetical protein